MTHYAASEMDPTGYWNSELGFPIAVKNLSTFFCFFNWQNHRYVSRSKTIFSSNSIHPRFLYCIIRNILKYYNTEHIIYKNFMWRSSWWHSQLCHDLSNFIINIRNLRSTCLYSWNLISIATLKSSIVKNVYFTLLNCVFILSDCEMKSIYELALREKMWIIKLLKNTIPLPSIPNGNCY